jgi:hypothetical protein
MTTANLPDPSQPSFSLLVAALGAFLGASLARLNGGEREEIRRSVEDWAYISTAVALVIYLLVLLLQLR